MEEDDEAQEGDEGGEEDDEGSEAQEDEEEDSGDQEQGASAKISVKLQLMYTAEGYVPDCFIGSIETLSIPGRWGRYAYLVTRSLPYQSTHVCPSWSFRTASVPLYDV